MMFSSVFNLNRRIFFVEIVLSKLLSQTIVSSLLMYIEKKESTDVYYFLEWPEMIDSALSSSSTTDQTISTNSDRTAITTSPSLLSLSNFDDETKTRILTLLKELGQSSNSSSQTDHPLTTKLAFIGKNLYVCSTCTGPVQWV